ncbi:MAG: FAD-dependent oxidoreductase [Actinoallomurus sp.]
MVIGAGPVGENGADRVVQGGLTAAIVERELVGGECSYWACMPTKALPHSATALRAARQLPGAREAVTGDLDTAAALRRRDSFASHRKDDGQVFLTRLGRHRALPGTRDGSAPTGSSSPGRHRPARGGAWTGREAAAASEVGRLGRPGIWPWSWVPGWRRCGSWSVTGTPW